MKITRRDFKWAVDQGLIEPDRAERLWQALAARVARRPRFDMTHVAYYGGATVIILAMTWFMTEAWDRYGELGLLALAALYCAAFGYAAATFWQRPGMRIPAGLLATVAICMVPLAIFAVQSLLGFRPDASLAPEHATFQFRLLRSFVFMETGAILASLVTLRYIRFPFLVMPIAVALHYMALEIPNLVYGPRAYNIVDHQWISLWFGLGVLLVAYLVDRRTREDYAFWLYLFGTLTFFRGLSLLASWDVDDLVPMHLYLLASVAMMLVSVLLQRRVLLIFGAVGVVGYLGFMAWVVFKDSLMFPFLLTAIGVAIIWAGVGLNRHSEKIEARILGRLPEGVNRWLPSGRTPPE